MPWSINVLPLASVDERSHVATLAVDATTPPFAYLVVARHKHEKWMWVENVLDYLDEPGEWIVNTDERKNLNHLENNIFFNVGDGKKPYVDFCSCSQDTPVRGSRFQRNIYYDFGARPIFYRDGYDPTGKRPNPMSSCEADHNLFYTAGDPKFAVHFLETRKKKGIEQHSIATDPKFVDAANGDFRLAPDSPAFELGFQPIDTTRIGLLAADNDAPTRQREAADTHLKE